MRKPLLLLSLLALSSGLTSLGSAQALPPCNADSGGRAGMLYYLKALATATDSESVAMRTTLGIPAVAASQVTAVTTNSTCTSAGQAVSRVLAVTPPNGRSVAVIKVGSVYAVRDPTVLNGNWSVTFVFNSTFQVLKSRYGP